MCPLTPETKTSSRARWLGVPLLMIGAILGSTACTPQTPGSMAGIPDLQDPALPDAATAASTDPSGDDAGTANADLSVVPDLAELPNEAIVSWSAVTTNTDGTPCTNLAGYYLYHGTISPITTANSTRVDVGNVLSYTFYNLPSGTHYFAGSAYTTDGVESDFSMTASKVIP